MSTNDSVGIKIGLEHDQAATDKAIQAIEDNTSKMAKNLGNLKFDALTNALKTLTQGVTDLSKNFENIKFDKLTNGMKTAELEAIKMAKNSEQAIKSMDKAVEASSKQLAKFFNVDEGSKSFNRLKDIVKEAFQLDGIDKGISKINKLRDTMIQVGNDVAKIGTKSAEALAGSVNGNFSNVKIFSIEKYKAEVERAKAELLKLTNLADKNGINTTTNPMISGLMAQFTGTSLFTQGKNPIPNNTIEFVRNLQTQLKSAFETTNNTVNFNKIFDKATELQNKFNGLVPATLQTRLDALTSTNWSNTVKGTAEFEAALIRVKKATEDATKADADLRKQVQMRIQADLEDRKRTNQPFQDMLAGASKQGLKLYNGTDFVPKGYITDVKKAQEEAIATAQKMQSAVGAAQLAAINNTQSVENKRHTLTLGITELNRALDTLQKKADDYNRSLPIGSAGRVNTTNYASGINTSAIVDTKGLKDGKDALAALRKELADFLRENKTDIQLDRRLKAFAEETRQATVNMDKLRDKANSINSTFTNVTSKTYNQPDALKHSAVTNLQATLTSQLAQSTGSKAELDAIESTIRKLTIAIKDFRETGSRIKDSTGSPFDNLLKGVPTQLVTLGLMKQKITDALTAAGKGMKDLDNIELGKINKQLKDFGYQVNSATKEYEKLSNQKKGGIFAWLPESLSGMATRLAEFYSLRTVIFGVSSQFREATTAALNMNQAVYDILAISGESKSEFKKISDTIYDLAKSSRFTAQEVAELMQVIAQAGVAAKDLAAVSTAVDRFATATAANPRMAADLVTTSMNVYSIGAEDVTRSTNAMTAALNLSKLEAGGLSTAFNYLAPQAAQLGMSLEQTLAIIANMSQSGIKASTIGTGISQMLKEFSAPKERLKSMLASYNLTADDINPMKKAFPDIIETLQRVGVTVDDLFAAMETRVGRAAVTAINLSAESFRAMEANLTGTHAALIAYDKTMDGAKSRINVVKQSFQELATIVGESLAPSLIWLTGAMGDVIRIFSSDNGRIAKVTAEVMLLVSAIAALVTVSRTFLASSLAGAVTSAAASAAASFRLWAMGAITLTDMLAGARIAVAAFFAEMTLGSALATGGLSLLLAGLAYGAYKLIDSMGEERRKREELNKTMLASVDANDRMVRAANGIAHATKDASSATEAYNKAILDGKTHEEALAIAKERLTTGSVAYKNAIKEGKTHEQALVVTKDAVNKATAEQIRELNNFVREGGPQAKLIQQLMEENRLVEAGIELNRTKRRELAGNVHQNISSYNAALAQRDFVSEAVEKLGGGEKTKATWKKMYKDGTLPTSSKNLVDSKIKELKEEFNNSRPEFAYLNSLIGGDVDMTGDENSTKGTLINTTNGAFRLNEKKNPPKPVSSRKPKPASSGSGKDSGLAVDPGIQLEIDLYNNERQGIITKLKTAYHTEEQVVSLLDEIANLDSMVADLKEEGSVDKVNKAFKIYNKKTNTFTWNPAMVNTMHLDGKNIDKEYASSIEIAKKADEGIVQRRKEELEKLREEIAKVQRAHSTEVVKDEAAIRKEEVAKKLANLDKEIGDAYTSEESRSAAIAKAKFLAIEQAELALDAKIAALKQKKEDKTLSPEAKKSYEDMIIKAEAERPKMREEVEKGIDEKGHVGYVASKDRELKTEQQIAATKKAAIQIKEKEVWDAEELKNLKTEELDVEISSLSTQINISNARRRGAKDAAEESRYAAETADLLQKQNKLLADRNDLNRSYWDSFKDGAREAMVALTDMDKMFKNIGATLTNGIVNGLADAFTSMQTVMWNPDKQKEKDTRIEINKLTTEKAQLENDIATISTNTNNTPQELSDLNAKKAKLEDVNNSLGKQQEILKETTDAWHNFRKGLQSAMIGILKAIQNYINQMLAAYLVKTALEAGGKMLSGITGLWSGATTTSPNSLGSSGTPGQLSGGEYSAADGGLLTVKGFQRLAGGGMVNGIGGGYVPLSMGKAGVDSVPTMLMPGEMVIKKSAVDYYGADNLLALNEKRIQKFAEGGIVGGSKNSSSGGGGTPVTLQIVNITQDQQPPSVGDGQRVINIISADLAKKGQTYKTIKAVF